MFDRVLNISQGNDQIQLNYLNNDEFTCFENKFRFSYLKAYVDDFTVYELLYLNKKKKKARRKQKEHQKKLLHKIAATTLIVSISVFPV